ncbi:Short-chain dehydrogenase/reductase SDR [Apiospora phragmitis]|uniref:Short-chain dehydrogenase/reductase SDR n=1 Tax=Apiospora phragmitis TaxID=2905665 RepID=A0ABR1VPQ5_9PEZI
MSSYPAQAPENGANFTSKIHTEPYPYISQSQHAGHNILITGGARGIGRAMALAFVCAGASGIAVADISEESFGNLASDLLGAAKLHGHEYPQLILHQLDVTDEASVRRCATLISEEFKDGLDILVNNAGYMTPARPVPESDPETWWRTFEVNLKGPYLMSKYFVPLLLSSSATSSPAGGQMININSVAAHNLRPQASAYGTSKLAALRLTEFLLVEAGEQGLVSYSVHPGAVLTNLAKDGMPPETLAGLTDKPELVAETVAWLTGERRGWLAGRYVSATWDMEELMARKGEIVEGDKLKVRLVV